MWEVSIQSAKVSFRVHCTKITRLCVSNYAVIVVPPWEVTTFVPQGSFVTISCNATKPRQTPEWSIRLDSSMNFIQFPSLALNQLGFYKVPTDQSSDTIQLTIRNTNMDINGTEIRCFDGASLPEFPTIHETNLHVFFGKCYRITFMVWAS